MAGPRAEAVDGCPRGGGRSRRVTALVRIRELCPTRLADREEVMAYGIPAYRRPGGEPEIASAFGSAFGSAFASAFGSAFASAFAGRAAPLLLW
ncbi:hypothetical protein [Streptomyces wuyuanensis]|uniref:hypothetical protein n=1 Tax=Streptomyces wuyuanensis TaxID=1196353 RepID=UPI003D71DCCE